MANGLALHYAEAGDSDRPLVLFLHGFPEFWYCWRNVLQTLGGAYHCVAPDLPGYNLSSKPSQVERYRTKHLVADVEAFAANFSRGRKFILVAHDWGGAVAWAFAIRKPHLLDRLVIINAAHPGAFAREVMRNPAQAKASAYIDAIRVQGSELLFAANDFEALWRAFAEAEAAGHLTREDRDAYRRAWSQPGALEGMFNWYRAMRATHIPSGGPAAQEVPEPDGGLRVEVPTLIIWGMKDTALLPGCIEGLERWVPLVDIRPVPEGTHWIVHESPTLVSSTISDWLAVR